MGTRIGIIAGQGKFPLLALAEARKKGYTCVVAGIKGEADRTLEEKADEFEWIGASQISKLMSFFKKHQVHEAIMAGKVSERLIYKTEDFDETSLRLLAQLKDRSPSVLIRAIIEFLTSQGIEVKDPTFFLSSYFCEEGVLTENKPSTSVLEDIDFGWGIAKLIADLDIGQTVIVKEKAVVAVEGIEGTDEAIKRGGKLAGEGIVVVKVSRSRQDPRIDLPAVGLETLRSLIKAEGVALCFEAQRVPFFQKEKGISLANANKISIVVKKS